MSRFIVISQFLVFLCVLSFTTARSQIDESQADTALISANLEKAADAKADSAIRLYSTAIHLA